MLRRLALCSGALLALGTATPQATALSFSLSPTTLQLDPARRLTTFTTFRNLDRTPVEFTVEVVRWSQVDGKDVLEPTDEVVVNPVRFTLKPGGSQIIRLGVRKKPDRPEMTYRLLVRQQRPTTDVPTTTPAPGTSRVNIIRLLNLSLPVSVASAESRPDMRYSLQRQDQNLVLQLSNAGSRHEALRSLTVEGGGRTMKVDNKAVLAGSTVSVVLPGWGTAMGPLHLSFTDHLGKGQRVSAQVPSP